VKDDDDMVERSRGGVSVCVYVCVGLSVCVCVRRDWGRERAKRGAARRGRMACGSEHPDDELAREGGRSGNS